MQGSKVYLVLDVFYNLYYCCQFAFVFFVALFDSLTVACSGGGWDDIIIWKF